MRIDERMVSMMDISRFVNESKQSRNYIDYAIETESYVLMKKELYEKLRDRKPIIHAHAIIDWLGNPKCSNCGSANIDVTEPYCQHCGANLDEQEERED